MAVPFRVPAQYGPRPRATSDRNCSITARACPACQPSSPSWLRNPTPRGPTVEIRRADPTNRDRGNAHPKRGLHMPHRLPLRARRGAAPPRAAGHRRPGSHPTSHVTAAMRLQRRSRALCLSPGRRGPSPARVPPSSGGGPVRRRPPIRPWRGAVTQRRTPIEPGVADLGPGPADTRPTGGRSHAPGATPPRLRPVVTGQDDRPEQRLELHIAPDGRCTLIFPPWQHPRAPRASGPAEPTSACPPSTDMPWNGSSVRLGVTISRWPSTG